MMSYSRSPGRHRARRRAGLTLIELLVTATLLGIGLSAVSVMFIYAYQAQINAHYVCQEGPVFTYSELRAMDEAL